MGKFDQHSSRHLVIRTHSPGFAYQPALWMLPTDQVYGSWPLSGEIPRSHKFPHVNPFVSAGEIDIMESRGNGPLYPRQCVNHK